MGSLPLTAPAPPTDRNASSHAATQRRRGRWVFALLLGVGITLIIFGQVTGLLSTWAGESVATGVERAIVAALDPPATGADRRRVFIVDSSGHPTAAELDAFAREFEQRYGRLATVAITGVTRDQDDLDMSAGVTLRTGSGEHLCAVRFRVLPSSPTEVALRGLEILDLSRGDLAVGERSDESLRSTPPTTALHARP